VAENAPNHILEADERHKSCLIRYKYKSFAFSTVLSEIYLDEGIPFSDDSPAVKQAGQRPGELWR